MTLRLIVAGLVLSTLGCGRTEAGSEPRHFAFTADSAKLDRFDLHVVDATDPESEIRVIASSVGAAAWSPDGRWLAFSGDGVFVADSERDFALRQLGGEGSALRWSAASRWIAFYVQTPSLALVLHDVLGLEPDRVEAVEESSNRAGTGWSPLGDAYLFQRSDQLNEPEEWFVVTPGEAARPLGILATGMTARNLGWSPDGQRIAMYLTGDDDRELLFAVDVHERPMLPRLLLDPGPGSAVNGYAWSGDSSLLIASSAPGITLWRVPADGGSSPEAFAQQTQHWQLGDHGRTLAYVLDQQLYAHTLSGGQISEPTLIEARAIDTLHATAHSDSLLFQLMAEPGRSYLARASGGPAAPLHEPERQHPGHTEPPVSPEGRFALLDLDAGEVGRELRAVELGDSPALRVSIPVNENNPFDLVEWGDASRFSFAYAVDGWQSLYLGSIEDGSVSRVYAPASNLRTIQWTGWQR